MDSTNNAAIKISVIIPVYNADRYLKECLDSVLSQSLKEIEVICVDDCSVDDSYDILTNYADKDERVIVLRNDSNMHAGACRNRGIDAARGEYLRFLDADDYLLDGVLEAEYNIAEKNNLDFIKTKSIEIDAVTSVENTAPSNYNLACFPAEFFNVVINFRETPTAFRKVSVVPWNGIYRRSFVIDNGLRFNTLVCVNDRSFYAASLVYARRVMILDMNTVYHRTNNPESLVGKRFDNFDCHFRSFEKILEIISPLPDNLKYRIMDFELTDVCSWFRKINNRDTFQRLYNVTREFFGGIDIDFMRNEAVQAKENLDSKIWSKFYDDIQSMTCSEFIIENKIKFCRPRENRSFDVKISIIIPVYNMEDYLDACLDSILYQTLGEIEVICVDDNSSDDSVNVLERRAGVDSRIKVIRHETNQSASQCRKDGVMAASGKYIMFVDADDSLKPRSLESLYNEMEEDPVDILHFNADIINEGDLPDKRIDNMKIFVTPYDGSLKGYDIFEKCFSAKKYRFSLWNKIYDSSLCKLAFEDIKDGSFPKAQDLYAYFVLAFYAESYRGIPEQTYYEYHFGRGSTGHNSLDMTQFERYCKMGLVADAVREFLAEHRALRVFEKEYYSLRADLVNDCFSQWDNFIENENKAEGLELMLKFFKPHEIISRAVGSYSTNQGELAKIAAQTNSFNTEPRKVKTIGMHYFRLSNGGIQRVISLLSFLFVGMGYEVVILCEEEPSENDYDLPEGVKIVVLPNIKTSFKTLDKHLAAFCTSLADYHIDMIIDHAWVDYFGLLAHMLSAKALGIPYVMHCHNIYSAPMIKSALFFADMPYIYALADHIVALSETDREYWQQFNNNVTVVANPMTFDLNTVTPVSLESKNIIWIARVSSEKQPYDAVDIFKLIADQIPETKMYLVGSAKTDSEMNALKKYINTIGLTDRIIVTGFVKDVETYYNDSSVFLCTSVYEGWLMTLLEGQSFGIPTVMYEMPWLTITQGEQGIVTVPQGDKRQAALEVLKLLNDDELRISMGKTARENIERIAAFDYSGTWRGVIECMETERTFKTNDAIRATMFDVMYWHYRRHILDMNGYIKPNDKVKVNAKEWLTVNDIIEKLNWNRSDRKKLMLENNKLRQDAKSKQDYGKLKSEREEYLREIINIRSSLSFKLGRLITWLPRKIRGLFKK